MIVIFYAAKSERYFNRIKKKCYAVYTFVYCFSFKKRKKEEKRCKTMYIHFSHVRREMFKKS